MSKVSVIIPHYNSPEKLIRLIDSIEDSPAVEVIIVDDKSTNDISRLQDIISRRKNTLLIENTSTKKGAGVSRNIGIDKSTGEWLLFADADDFFLQGTWEYIQKFSDSEVDIIYFAPTSIEEESFEKSDRHLIYESLVNNYLESPNLENELSLRAEYIVPWSKMIKKSIIIRNEITFDEIIVSNDVMFSVKAGFYAENIHAVKYPIYCATKDTSTLSTSVSFEKYKIRTDTYIEYHKFLQNKLTRKDYLKLKIYGAGWLYRGISQDIPIKYILKTLLVMIRNKIQIAPINFSVFSRVYQNIKSNVKEKKFLK